MKKYFLLVLIFGLVLCGQRTGRAQDVAEPGDQGPAAVAQEVSPDTDATDTEANQVGENIGQDSEGLGDGKEIEAVEEDKGADAIVENLPNPP